MTLLKCRWFIFNMGIIVSFWGFIEIMHLKYLTTMHLSNVRTHYWCIPSLSVCGRAQSHKDKWHMSASLRLLRGRFRSWWKQNSVFRIQAQDTVLKKQQQGTYCSLFLQWVTSPFSFTEAAVHFQCPELDSDALNFIIRRNAVKTVTEIQNFSPKRITAQSFHI